MTEILIGGDTVRLLVDGALYWQRTATLVVADPHFGKDDIFRRSGIAVPRGPTVRDLERLSTQLAATAARRLLIVGDFIHGRSESGDDVRRQFVLWRRRHPDLQVTLIAGNHDRHEDWARWQPVMEVRTSALHEGPFVFAHEPLPSPQGFVVAGHIHPVYRNRGLLGPRALRVFWVRPHCIVLPSWGEFTGGWAVQPARDESLFACTPEGVLTLQTGRPT